MFIRHVAISHFRGIESLDWHVNGRLVCLVGPGDSTKTTILDAIELALAPRWFVPFADADFFQADTSQPISISVTIGELPNELLGDEKCGLYLRGYRPNNFHDDPEDGWEPVVTVQLHVTDDLEPRWELAKENLPDLRPLSWRDRERLGMARLGDDIERHLTWSRGSALAKITEKETTAGPTLALANRAANAAILGATNLGELEAAAALAREAAEKFGVKSSPLRPGLDTQSVSFGTGALSLHDEQKIPFRAVGLGTRRLAGLAVQQAGLGPDAILLIDEIEYGLEPHRIRRLLNKLIADHEAETTDGGEQETSHGQVLMTTHSPTAIMALPVTDLRFVKSVGGATTVAQVDSDTVDAIQPIVRKIGHALLARKIVVCEGKTEEALCRVLDQAWASDHDGHTFGYLGIVPVYGEGRTNGPKAAAEFRRIGYTVAFVGDSDEPIQPDQANLEAIGVKVVLWEGNMATEQRIASDLPWASLQTLVNAAIDERGEMSILDSIGRCLGRTLTSTGPSIDNWLSESTDVQVRAAIGQTAKQNGWFKNLNAGERLARIVVGALPEMAASAFSQSLSLLEDWVYGE